MCFVKEIRGGVARTAGELVASMDTSCLQRAWGQSRAWRKAHTLLLMVYPNNCDILICHKQSRFSFSRVIPHTFLSDVGLLVSIQCNTSHKKKAILCALQYEYVLQRPSSGHIFSGN